MYAFDLINLNIRCLFEFYKPIHYHSLYAHCIAGKYNFNKFKIITTKAFVSTRVVFKTTSVKYTKVIDICFTLTRHFCIVILEKQTTCFA